MGPAVAIIVVTTLLGGGRTMGWIRRATTATSQRSTSTTNTSSGRTSRRTAAPAHATASRCGRISSRMRWISSVAFETVDLAQGPRQRERHRVHVPDAARVRRHDVDGLGEKHRLAQVVGHQHAGERAVAPEHLVQLPHLLARERVQRGERFVEQQERRLVDQRAAEAHALAHPARELARLPAFGAVEPDRVQERPRPLPPRGALRRSRITVLAQDLEGEQQIVEHGPPRKQDRVLEGHAHVLQRAHHRPTIDRRPGRA